MALKLSTVAEQKSLWRNLMALQSTRVWSHQQQRGLAPSAMSKGTHTRPAQIPEHARFLMKRLVTDLKTFVQQVHHNTVAFPVGKRKEVQSFKINQIQCLSSDLQNVLQSLKPGVDNIEETSESMLDCARIQPNKISPPPSSLPPKPLHRNTWRHTAWLHWLPCSFSWKIQ